jgi:hypothetical protein
MSNTLVLCLSDHNNAFDADCTPPNPISQPDYSRGISAHHNQLLTDMWIHEMESKIKLIGKT